jgi:hypothetical protein
MSRSLTNVSLFESLETRTLMSKSPLSIAIKDTSAGPSLVINGSTASDKVIVNRYGNTGVSVNDGKNTFTFKKGFNTIIVNGGNGNDLIRVASNVKMNAIVNGGNGHDTIQGGAGKDQLVGANGNDRIYGNAGNDILTGTAGNDSIFGGAGKDQLIGGAGDDSLVAVGGGGNDSLCGDSGFDSYWMDDSMYEHVMDMISSEESYNMAVHRVDSFMDFVMTDGVRVPTPTELSGQQLPDPQFHWGDSQNYSAEKYVNFYGKPLFGPNGPSMNDINQGNVGSCYFLSTIAAVAMDNPCWIKQSVVDFGDGTFGVRFIGDNYESRFVRVDGDLAVNTMSDGSLALAYTGFGNGGAVWAPILEKAWTYFRKQSERKDGIKATSYQAIDGGWLDEAFNAMGAMNVFKNDPNRNPFTNGNDLLGWIEEQLEMGNTLTFATHRNPTSTSGLVELHAYTVVDVIQGQDGQMYLKVRNPWGVDGRGSDGANDGYVYVSANDAHASFMQFGCATL